MKPLGPGSTSLALGQRGILPSTLKRKSPWPLRSPPKLSQPRSILCCAVGMTSSPESALSANEAREESTLSVGSRRSRLISWVRWRLGRVLTVLKMVGSCTRYREPNHACLWNPTDHNHPAENHHFRLELILDRMVEVTLLDNLRRLPLSSTLSRYFLAPVTARVHRNTSHIAGLKFRSKQTSILLIGA